MAKKKVVKTNNIFLVAILLGILAVVAFLFPFVRMYQTLITEGSYTKANFSGFALAFGSENIKVITYSSLFKTSTETATTVESVIFALIALIATGVGILASATNLVVTKKASKIVNLIAAVLFIAGGVFAFLTHNQYLVANFADDEGVVAESIKEAYTLGFGAIICISCNGLAGLVSLYKAAV